MAHKYDVAKVFATFQIFVEKYLNCSIKAVQPDNGGEFRGMFSQYLASSCIKHRFTCPHTSQLNGIVERKYRHVVESDLTLLAQASPPLKYWSDAFFSATFLIN